MKDNKIWIVLSDTGSVLNNLIKKYLNCQYGHVSMAFDDKLTEMYSFGRIYPSNPLFAGFIKEDVYKGTYTRFPNTKIAIYEMSLTDKQYDTLRKEVEYFYNNSSYLKYSIIGFKDVVRNKPAIRYSEYFCSQFVAHVLEMSGISLFDKSSNLVTPKDFYNSSALKKVYEGKLYNYIFTIIPPTRIARFKTFNGTIYNRLKNRLIST